MRLKGLILVLLLCYVVVAKTRYERGKFTPQNLQGYQGPEVTFYSGYLQVSNLTDSHLYFIFVPSSGTQPDKLPIVLFLNGGPGCSSMISFFKETGPVVLSEDGTKFVANTFSWHNRVNMLYIDNPVGIGYSYTNDSNNIPSSAMEVGQHLLIGLNDFFKLDDFQIYRNNPFYIFGESYGARYAIAVAYMLMNGVSHLPPSAFIDPNSVYYLNLNLQGIALGNGWVAPDIQERSYGEFAYSVGLINYMDYVTETNLADTCHKLISQKKYFEAEVVACEKLWYNIIKIGGGFNGYDYRLIGNYKFLNDLYTFLSRNTTISLLNAKSDINFQLCRTAVFKMFLTEFQANFATYLPQILTKYRVLIYNGQFDLRCNIYGTNEWLKTLPWEGKQTFNYMSHDILYSQESVPTGIFKQYKNLYQVVVYNAGHLVPFDQPQTAYEMITRFIPVTQYFLPPTFCTAKNGANCQVAPCPNNCANHGICDVNTNKCKCNDNYSGEDCSVFTRTVPIGTTTPVTGYIFGKNYHLYLFSVVGVQGFPNSNNNIQNGSVPITYEGAKMDLKFKFSKTKPIGKIHIYTNVGNFVSEPNDRSDDYLRRQFQYLETEDTMQKDFEFNDIPFSPNVTVLVYNTIYTETSYNLDIKIEFNGLKLDAPTTTLLVFIFLTLTVVIILSAISLVLLGLMLSSFIASKLRQR